MTQQITLIKDKILSDNYFTLHNITYDLTRKDGEVIRHKREVYDRGNGATILLYNAKKKTVVLIRQFRVATWVNGNESGQLIETCAGLLDNDEPEVCIRKEAIEETGYEVIEVLELPFSQALEMIKTGEIRDGKTVLLLNYLQTSHLMD
ncbi:GDP-mannose pyrophosphatase NudK [Shigella sonnei]